MKSFYINTKHKRSYALIIASIFFALCICGKPVYASTTTYNGINYADVFHADHYLASYGDLQTAFGNNPSKLLEHFVTYGMKEGRCATPAFQIQIYMDNNPDLIDVFGTSDLSAYYTHYIKHGKSEGRVAGTGAPVASPPLTTPIASVSTSYKSGQARGANIELSTGRINGMILAPGQSFSFSNTILSRTAANGYLMAASFADKKIVDSVGGGICQVSSTLYAALVQAEIVATERHAHSLPVTYLPEGLDATIVEGSKDLKFVNPYPQPLTISATASNGTLTISLIQK